MQKNILIGLLTLVIVLGGGFLYRQMVHLEMQLQAMPAQMAAQQRSVPHSSNGKRQEDPYIAGPVKNTILKHYGDVAKLYARYLKSDPKKIDGIVKVDWRIDREGHVISPGVIYSELDGGSIMEQGIVDLIAAWNFPPPMTGMPAYVAHSFNLRKNPPSPEELEQQRHTQVESMVQSMNGGKGK
ncbi:MAG: AgmX/PglI C-terminal domain-containing protein [Mariprofundaceae bacterium]|nr:AgmX/PglI C-terminal domain-containing protein [Mariprofundaceae bacterium]